MAIARRWRGWGGGPGWRRRVRRALRQRRSPAPGANRGRLTRLASPTSRHDHPDL